MDDEEGKVVADDGRIQVREFTGPHNEVHAHVYVLGVRVNVTCRGQAVWIANALAPKLDEAIAAAAAAMVAARS